MLLPLPLPHTLGPHLTPTLCKMMAGIPRMEVRGDGGLSGNRFRT